MRLEAVLHISSWYSWCSNCRMQTLPDAISHTTVSGYGPSKDGCGAVFTSVTSDYGNDAACRRIRPDLPLARVGANR